jgi:triosephosphate isomerase (TIM)
MKYTSLTFAAALLLASASAFSPSFVRTVHRGASASSSLALDMARKPFISGNWKLNPTTIEEAEKLAAGIAGSITDKSPDADVAIFVPYVFVGAAQSKAADSSLMIGAEVRQVGMGFDGMGFAHAVQLLSPWIHPTLLFEVIPSPCL